VNHQTNHVKNNTAKPKEESVDEQLLIMREKLRQIESAILNKEPQHQHQKNYPPKAIIDSNQQPQLLLSPSLYQSQDDSVADGPIDFYKNNHGNPRMISQGVLSWVTLLKKDVYLRSIVDSSRRKTVITNASKAQVSQVSQVRENEFVKKFKVESDLDADIRGDYSTLSTCSKFRNKDVLYMIENTLKDAKLIWLLVDKFFESELYCAMPLLDKSDFTSQLFDIIGPKSSQKITLCIKKKLQLTTIGILLLMMRLSSLSNYNALKGNVNEMSDNDKYIYNNQIGKDIMIVAESCYDEISKFRESHLEIFQFQLFLRYYEFFAPEDSDCISMSSNANMGPLMYSAVSAGLNRDPSVSETPYKNPNLLRRLWFKVVNLDYNQLMLIGCPPMIDVRFYDTNYPHLDPTDSALEYGINKGISERKDIYEMCHPLLMLILNVRDPPLISVVKQYLAPLERYVKNHRKVDDIMKMPSEGVLQRWEKSRLLVSLVDSSLLIYMIYYHFFLYFNEKGMKDKSVYYLAEMLKLVSTLLPLIKFLLKDTKSSEYFNLKNHFGTPLIVISKISMSAHRCIQLMFTILARIKGLKVFTIDMDEQKLNILDSIADLSLRTCSYILKGFLNIADTYYHAWAMNKMHTFIVKDILGNRKGPYDSGNIPENDKQFIKNLHAAREHDEIFTKYSMDDLKLIHGLLTNLEACGRDPEKSSPSGSSVDFGTTDNQIDSIWFDQLQSETNVMYENGNNPISSSIPHNGSQMVEESLDRNEDPFVDWDVFDVERFLYQSTNESLMKNVNT